MRNSRIERFLVEVDDYRDRWERFRDFLRRGFSKQAATAEDDAEFLRLKSELACDYETLLGGLGIDPEPDHAALRSLAAATSLQRLGELDVAEARALETEWHAAYINLQSLSGRLKALKLQLASTSAVGYYLARVLRSPVFVLLLLGAMITAGLWYWNFIQPSSDNAIESRGPRPTLETTIKP